MEGAPGFPLRGSFPVHGPEDSRVKTERIAAEISHVTEKGRCFGRQGSLWTTSGGRAFGREFCGRRASRAIAGSAVPPLPNRDHTVPRPDQSPPQIPRTRQFILSTSLRFFFSPSPILFSAVALLPSVVGSAGEWTVMETANKRCGLIAP